MEWEQNIGFVGLKFMHTNFHIHLIQLMINVRIACSTAVWVHPLHSRGSVCGLRKKNVNMTWPCIDVGAVFEANCVHVSQKSCGIIHRIT